MIYKWLWPKNQSHFQGIMPIIKVKNYTREQIQANRTSLYVFGDNMCRTGFGGQAKEARGEFNSIGIVTKWSPSTDLSAYFTDKDLHEVQSTIDQAFGVLEQKLKAGGIVVLPIDGVGRGRAELDVRAPRIMEYIDLRINQLEDIKENNDKH